MCLWKQNGATRDIINVPKIIWILCCGNAVGMELSNTWRLFRSVQLPGYELNTRVTTVRFSKWAGSFFSEMSTVSLRATHPHCMVTGGGGIFSLGIKRPGLFALIHLLWNLRSCAAVPPTPSFPFMMRRFIKHNYNLTFCQLRIISNTVVTLRTMYHVLRSRTLHFGHILFHIIATTVIN